MKNICVPITIGILVKENSAKNFKHETLNIKLFYAKFTQNSIYFMQNTSKQ